MRDEKKPAEVKPSENQGNNASSNASRPINLSSEIPNGFICPITIEIMDDPVIAADGHSYERMAIEGWFRTGHDKSPMTGLALANQDLIPNVNLRKAIAEYLEKRPNLQRILDQQALLQAIQKRAAELEAALEKAKSGGTSEPKSGLFAKSEKDKDKNNKQKPEDEPDQEANTKCLIM